jgi:hypothetical protein
MHDYRSNRRRFSILEPRLFGRDQQKSGESLPRPNRTQQLWCSSLILHVTWAGGGFRGSFGNRCASPAILLLVLAATAEFKRPRKDLVQLACCISQVFGIEMRVSRRHPQILVTQKLSHRVKVHSAHAHLGGVGVPQVVNRELQNLLFVFFNKEPSAPEELRYPIEISFRWGC